MNKLITLSTSTVVLSGLLMITGCSSSDDDSSSGDGSNDNVPANAVVINEANAEATIQSSITTTDTFDLAFGIETAPAMGLKDALALIEPRLESIKNTLKNSGADPAYVVAIDKSGNCEVGGTFSFSGEETGTSPKFTDSGTSSMVNCDDGFGIINGTLTWLESWNEETGNYSDTVTGSITIENTDPQNAFKFSFTGLDFAETGNDITGTYTITRATYAIDFISSGTGSGGFLVNLTANIVESSGGESSCPESGHITITGANGSTAEGIYNGNNSMTIKANGAVVTDTAECYH